MVELIEDLGFFVHNVWSPPRPPSLGDCTGSAHHPKTPTIRLISHFWHVIGRQRGHRRWPNVERKEEVDLNLY